MRFLISWDPEHIREQAAASTARYAAGVPLSPLDGVPFAVKDGGDAAPYPTTAGTAFMAAWWGIASCTLLRVFFLESQFGRGFPCTLCGFSCAQREDGGSGAQL